MDFESAGEEIRTPEPLRDQILSLAPLARLGYPCTNNNYNLD